MPGFFGSYIFCKLVVYPVFNLAPQSWLVWRKSGVCCCCWFLFCFVFFFPTEVTEGLRSSNRQRDFENNGERRCRALISLAVCSGCCCHCDNMTAKTNYREQGSGVRVYLIVKPDIVAPLLNLTDYLTQLITSWLFCLSLGILLTWPTRLLAGEEERCAGLFHRS